MSTGGVGVGADQSYAGVRVGSGFGADAGGCKFGTELGSEGMDEGVPLGCAAGSDGSAGEVGLKAVGSIIILNLSYYCLSFNVYYITTRVQHKGIIYSSHKTKRVFFWGCHTGLCHFY